MKNASKKFTAKHIEKVAKSTDARGFYEWIETYNVDCVVDVMTITDLNEDYFNVIIPIEDGVSLDVLYCNGVLETATVNTLSDL